MSYDPSAAFLSSLIYDDSRINLTTIGSTYIDLQGNAWQLQYLKNGNDANGVANGYQGAIFINTDTGQVVLVNRGTELTSLSDLKTDIEMGLGQVPSQYQSAQELYGIAAALAASTDSPLLVTGHSLGGSIAQLIGAQYGAETQTFNPYGVGNLLPALGITGSSFANITNNILPYDLVSVSPGSNMIGNTLQYSRPMDAALSQPNVIGLVILSSPWAMLYSFSSHAITNFLDPLLSSQSGRAVSINIPNFLPFINDVASLLSLSGPIGLITLLQGLLASAENQSTASPIVLDLDGDGVETLSKTAGVHFDLDNNGFAELTGWVSADDGLLVWDRDGNGSIDNGSELFGNHTLLSNGQEAANGFAALSELDADHDGDVDANDVAFGDLRIWRDLNQDGVSQSEELFALTELDIASISVSYTSSTSSDTQGNAHKQIGGFTWGDGGTGTATDVWFSIDPARTEDHDLVAVPKAVAALPDVAGFGNVHSLHQAMARDETGQLQALVQAFAAETDAAARDDLIMQIVYAWAGVEDVVPSSRGGYIDARKLAALETFLGDDFQQRGQNSNPNGAAAGILSSAFDALIDYVDAQLMRQTHFAFLYDSIGLAWDEGSGQFTLELSSTVALLQERYGTDPDAAHALMREFGSNLKAQGDAGVQVLQQLEQMGNRLGAGFTFALATLGNTFAQGGDGNDTLNGDADDDVLNGGDGSDNLNGGTGDDVLDGGADNDTLNGGAGNDIYLFGVGSGQDTLNNYHADTGTTDTIRLTGGLGLADVTLSGSGSDLLLTIGDGTDQLRIYAWFTTSNTSRYQGLQIVTDDGTTVSLPDLLAAQTGFVWATSATANTIQGIAGNDLIAGLGGNDTLYGNDGNDALDGGDGDDLLTGGNGADLLIGGSGIDRLFGNNGNDTLNGGEGYDTLTGGTGNDTYLFEIGDGSDIIVENDSTPGSTDLAQFASGIATDQLWFQHVGNNLEISIIGTTDKLTIQNWYSGSAHHVEQFKTADDKLLTDARVESLVQAMAIFSPPATGETTLPPAYQTALAPVIAANWQ